MNLFSYTEIQTTPSEKNAIPLPLQMRAAIATSLGAAAANAKSLADQEHREIEHLVATIIETQVAYSSLMLLSFRLLIFELMVVSQKKSIHCPVSVLGIAANSSSSSLLL